jgi:hypothetical protein
MIEDRPETDIEFDSMGVTGAHKFRRAECYCCRATLDDLLSDEVMGRFCAARVTSRMNFAR